ncbi:deoxycytidylate deaminase-like [Haliotis rufescens]|uniref:deoxycytidylate deaminase-like n=1 Tax=Haliotis rufescens TaxID=6454 RepID=UPI00201EC353|nr:deoxycytidylate deaminase-like [Haliotis rufescens]XP_048240705.1 deoxycytidylate deaminase-like [Haliotis rufescens]
MIIQSGIHEVVYLSDEKKEKDEVKASKILLEMADVKYRAYEGKMDPIKIQFAPGSTDNVDPVQEQLLPSSTDDSDY